jgi:protoheme IX farnesyltransferase
MFQNLKLFFKARVLIFVVASEIAGYALGFSVEQKFTITHFLMFLLGSCLLSAGSLSLNEVQEIENDSKMDRTQTRPLVTGAISKQTGFIVSVLLILVGLGILWFMKPLTFLLGFLTVATYNGFYTMYWKKKWAFAAVPGSIPGALPATMGFSVVNDHIFSTESVYLFLVLFVWQMPHFWSVAIKYSKDYKDGSFPVLPVTVGTGRTKYHISFYVWAYALLGIMSPFFVDFSYAYFLGVLPFSVLIVWQFLVFFKEESKKHWGRFFAITNLSLLVFMFAPIIDRWIPIFFHV